MNERFVCIHGHFYQPPREDPWLETILPEGTAAPAENWNRRIIRESYAPMAFARRLGEGGRIHSIVNCYEWISFNFGPTLLTWLAREMPETYERILEADRASLRRWGRGNAMAQVRHHAILPLASERDKRLEVAWAMDDFRARYRRDPEGMWLAEAAVDTPTLEVLAELGVRFTVLAPRQARAVAAPGGGFAPVDEGSLDVTRPYKVELPSGRELAIFFYHGPISQAVAFEGLLKDGEAFFKRIAGAAPPPGDGLLSLATDGETYGHHFPFGEMALAYLLEQARSGREGLALTNFAAFLADNPPQWRVQVAEPSSWSCVHGVERWRSDCGCSTGGHPGWNQRWRAPLRQGLDALKVELDRHFDTSAAGIITEPERALLAYGAILSLREGRTQFEKDWFRPGLDEAARVRGWKLLDMARWGQAMFASCAWFFDDIARVEPRNALTFALRALQLAEETGGGDLSGLLLTNLERAVPNDPRFDTGLDLYQLEVLPRRQTVTTLAMLALTCLRSGGELRPGLDAESGVGMRWPALAVEVLAAAGDAARFTGRVRVRWRIYREETVMDFEWREGSDQDPFAGVLEFFVAPGRSETLMPSAMFWKNKELAVLCWHAPREEALWDQWLERGRTLLPRFLPYRAYQHTQVHEDFWAAQWAGLVAAFITDCCSMLARPDLVAFLKGHAGGQTAASLVRRKVGRMCLEFMRQGSEGLAQLAELLERCREIGLEPDLWRAQNVWWRTAGGERGST
ncbi:MAG: DUF3536 domain-containing protein, partial [Desulfovibrionaceae bacterium]